MWQDIILYTFLGYLLIHLIIDDIILIISYFKNDYVDPNNQQHLSGTEQRTIIKILFKVFDVVLECVKGYFDLFETCWTKSTDCLQTVMIRYIEFLETLCEKLLSYPTCLIVCTTAVFIVGFVCLIIWIIIK